MVRFRLKFPELRGFLRTCVSIPLWFDSDLENAFKAGHKIVWSQFHYGSIQMGIKLYGRVSLTESQFHYGSIQITAIDFLKKKRVSRLNSTMVRFRFLPLTIILIITIVVSIPLWFDSDKFGKVQKIREMLSLNSTMVRFRSDNDNNQFGD